MAKKPAKGSERPKAWLYAVLAPLLEALESEKRFLARGNLTWRYRSREPEYLAEPRLYLNSNGRANLSDLIKFHEDFGKRLERHKTLLAEAVVAAASVHAQLLVAPGFQSDVMAAAAAWQMAYPREHAFWQNDSELVALAAERLLNEVEELSSHYTDATFWKEARPTLMRFASPALLPLREKRQLLAADTDELIRAGTRLQDELCDEYDLPPAPLSSAYGG